MRPIRYSVAVAAAFALGAIAAGRPPVARADDRPAAGEPAKPEVKPEVKKDGAHDVQGKSQPAGPSRVERAKKIVQELETTLTILKATKTADAETVRSLERALEEAKKLARPITLDELTDEERKALTEEIRKQLGDDAPKEPSAAENKNPFEDWRQRALASAFKDADLNEDEQMEASKIIQDWFQKSEAARMARDSKAMSDLKGERDKAIEKAVGRKKAQKVINNLNSISGGRR
jgi:hypothetical protein